MRFYRGAFTTLHVLIRVSEPLALLETGFVEDFYGVDDQLTLYHLESRRRFELLMTNTPEGNLEGYYSLDALPNGVFEVQGRMKDALGNATIFNAVETPGPGAVLPLRVSVLPGTPQTPRVSEGPLFVAGGVSLGLPFTPARLTRRVDLSAAPLELSPSLGAS